MLAAAAGGEPAVALAVPQASATAADNTLPPKGWRLLGAPASELRLEFTLPTGQSFRWQQTGAGEYSGVIGQRVVSRFCCGLLCARLNASTFQQALPVAPWNARGAKHSGIHSRRCGCANWRMTLRTKWWRGGRTHRPPRCAIAPLRRHAVEQAPPRVRATLRIGAVGGHGALLGDDCLCCWPALQDYETLHDYFNLGTSLAALAGGWSAADPRFAFVHPYFQGGHRLYISTLIGQALRTDCLGALSS